MQSISENGRILTADSLPRLRSSGNSTHSESVQSTEFKGTLGYWTAFEQEVRNTFYVQRWTENILSFRPSHHDPNHVYNEQLYVGDEHSMCARFGQQVGHVMTSIAQDLRIPVRFGDVKATSRDGTTIPTIPDFAVMDSTGKALLIGEAKAYWKHDITAILAEGTNLSLPFRKFLGQIAAYMKDYKMRYGFLTTYEQTMFFKQARASDGHWVLWYSRPIYFSTRSNFQDPNPNAPATYRDRVSIRECMLFFLAAAASGMYRAENDEAVWVGPSGRKYGAKKPGKHIDDRSTGGLAPLGGMSGYGGMTGESSRAGGSNRHNTNFATSTPQSIPLVYDSKKKKYYYADSRGKLQKAKGLTADQRGVWYMDVNGRRVGVYLAS